MWRTLSSFENTKLVLLGTKLMTYTFFPLVDLQLRVKMRGFYDTLCYLECEIEVKPLFPIEVKGVLCSSDNSNIS